MAKVNNTREILVYADWEGLNESTLMGRLSADQIRGKEVFSFEYEKDWLDAAYALYLDPNLQMFTGRQYLPEDKTNFGIFLDSSPDRWGRVLMKRREALFARKEDRKENTLFETDYLLGVFDEHRMGGLRFKLDENGSYLNNDRKFASPPWASLRELEYASEQLEKDDVVDDAEYAKWLNMLIAPGSSLGGARPKASIVDAKGHLWIAKFPSRYDDINIGAWEMIAQKLATSAGLRTAEVMLLNLSGKQDTFLTKRFDRANNGKRIHFASAMTLLGHNDGENHEAGISYLELAEIISHRGANIGEDLEELWRRIVFNICISNTDDHLRNHGFLLSKDGWHLSPAYDMNPVPTGTCLKLNISETDNSLNLDVAKDVAEYFRIKKERADEIIGEVVGAVKKWNVVAKELGLPNSQIEAMKKAFSNFEN
jgi:serine/threonine-protein kinase HipA